MIDAETLNVGPYGAMKFDRSQRRTVAQSIFWLP